jgi:hypothetical protein
VLLQSCHFFCWTVTPTLLCHRCDTTLLFPLSFSQVQWPMCCREHTFPSRIDPLVVCHLASQSSSLSLSSHSTLIGLFLPSSGSSIIPALSKSVTHLPGCLIPSCPVLVHVHFEFTGESSIVSIVFMPLSFHITITTCITLYLEDSESMYEPWTLLYNTIFAHIPFPSFLFHL